MDSSITRQFLENVEHTLNGRELDYLVVNHMEPDHCSNIEELLLRYPQNETHRKRQNLSVHPPVLYLRPDRPTITVKEGDQVFLGHHTLSFYFAPMVHWPEVMVTYEESEQILFSADAFGSFGAINGNLFDDEVDFDRDWLPDARRYYCNIVGKYGPQYRLP